MDATDWSEGVLDNWNENEDPNWDDLDDYYDYLNVDMEDMMDDLMNPDEIIQNLNSTEEWQQMEETFNNMTDWANETMDWDMDDD